MRAFFWQNTIKNIILEIAIFCKEINTRKQLRIFTISCLQAIMVEGSLGIGFSLIPTLRCDYFQINGKQKASMKISPVSETPSTFEHNEKSATP